jgi:hypothetical protein
MNYSRGSFIGFSVGSAIGLSAIKMKLEGVESNRSAIGARVLAHYGKKPQAQSVVSQSSFYSSSDARLHFRPRRAYGGRH